MVTTLPPAVDTERVAGIQQRTIRLLMATQTIGGIGVASGVAVGALLATAMAGATASGLAGSCAVVGSALLAIPATRFMRGRGGRRIGLAFLYAAGFTGAVVVIIGATLDLLALVFVGTFLFGGASTAGLQARYTAVDLATPERRARQLSVVVWALTIGAIAGPNLAPWTDSLVPQLPRYTGPYLFSALAFGLAAVAVLAFMRPDPLVVARTVAAATSTTAAGSWRGAFRAVRANPAARLGVAALATGHVVMVGVMAMTPVYIGIQHSHGDVLRLVGVVISLHIAGMSALAPLVGWLADRLGRRQVILGGLGTLLLACALAGTSGDDTVRLGAGLFLLGVGWSGTMVAGSTLLSESVAVRERPTVQGLADVVMGLAGALAGAVSGAIVEFFGYPALTLLAALAAMPLVAMALRPAPPPAVL
jgi:MFS family permease